MEIFFPSESRSSLLFMYEYTRESVCIINQMNETDRMNIMDNFVFKHDFRFLNEKNFLSNKLHK